jgi:hypothetical protein
MTRRLSLRHGQIAAAHLGKKPMALNASRTTPTTAAPTRDWVLVIRIAAMRTDVLGLKAATRNHSANSVPAVAAT